MEPFAGAPAAFLCLALAAEVSAKKRESSSPEDLDSTVDSLAFIEAV